MDNPQVSARDERRARIHTLVSDIGEVNDAITTLTNERDAMRHELANLVLEEGGKVELPGLAVTEWVPPYKKVAYDRERIDQVVDWLREQGLHDAADKLLGCRKTSNVKGSLRLSFEKPKPAEVPA